MELSNDQEKRVKQLKRSLEGWREIVLLLQSVFIWEQQWHLGAIIGAITAKFLLVWWLDPTILTLFSLIGLIGVLVDFFVPLLASNLFRPENWDGAKEKKFEQLCKILANAEASVYNFWNSFYTWRESRPKLVNLHDMPIKNLIWYLVLIKALKYHGVLRQLILDRGKYGK
ncbi:Hypothetical predicted protein [Cloeon dipterum]|uniref:Uncharacterized protein n=1 Tax=Cloeon dipterum TaxID=197152 RepID=A0A8S1CSC8_9INSE|nr:Hypothetical predicted protein [Cloeon dipterum]